MSERDRQLLELLLPIFREEAREHITAISSGIARLEDAVEERAALVEIVFRETHSLKAAARAVGQTEIERVCQSVEGIFASLKRDEIVLSRDLLDSLHSAADGLDDFLMAIDASPSAERQVRAASLAKSLDAALQAAIGTSRPGSETAAPAPPPLTASAPLAPAFRAPPVDLPAPETPPLEMRRSDAQSAPVVAPSDTVRLSIQRLDGLLRQAEEMLSEKLASRRLATELRDMTAAFSAWRAEATTAKEALASARPKRRGQSAPAESSHDAADQVVEFVERNEKQIRQFETRLLALGKLAVADARGLGSKVDGLLYDIKRTLTLPCSSLFQLFPRVVRDLARDMGKDVSLVVRGGELGMDRRILEELKDPLLHLIRNCIDHGIEPPDDRVAAGKPARATIAVSAAAAEGDKAEFAIADDGAGIARDLVLASATRLGLINADAADRPEAEVWPLIFQSGVSTSPMITDLSGRGLGLAIVREKVERLGGTVSVESRPGQGTAFRLVLPLTLATYRGVMVRAAGRLLAVPTLGVERVVNLMPSAIGSVQNRLVAEIAGIAMPLVWLSDVLELPPVRREAPADGHTVVLVLGATAGRVAFAVDAVEGDQELLMKPLGRYLARVRNVQGATVLPTGEIAPILSVHDLVKSAARVTRAGPPAEARQDAGAAPKSILVAEDSITARALLKAILEGAGYRVKTSVDGMDAWASLNLEPFDLLVSDVEMPRLNGFELTERIRADKALAELPVVLVTALESREHYERGADAGADAYITKGGFDQGRLIETVKRLI